MLRLLLPPPRSLCASTGHYPHLPSREPVQPTTASVQLPRENTRHASGWCNVTLASAAAGSPCIRTTPSPRPEWARAPESAASLTPSCLSEEQMPSGNLHSEASPNPKLNPGSCANKEEKRKFLPQPQEQLIKYPQSTWCMLHLWNTWIDNGSTHIEEVNLGSNDIYIFFLFSLFVSVYVYASVCDFVCIALLLPFVLDFCLSFFVFCFF